MGQGWPRGAKKGHPIAAPHGPPGHKKPGQCPGFSFDVESDLEVDPHAQKGLSQVVTTIVVIDGSGFTPEPEAATHVVVGAEEPGIRLGVGNRIVSLTKTNQQGGLVAETGAQVELKQFHFLGIAT